MKAIDRFLRLFDAHAQLKWFGNKGKASLPEGGMVEQFDAACGNVATGLQAAGARPEHLVSMQIFVTDLEAYRSNREAIGVAWRRHFGKHYPAMGLFEVRGLVDPRAKVELMAIAVRPDEPAG